MGEAEVLIYLVGVFSGACLMVIWIVFCTLIERGMNIKIRETVKEELKKGE